MMLSSVPAAATTAPTSTGQWVAAIVAALAFGLGVVTFIMNLVERRSRREADAKQAEDMKAAIDAEVADRKRQLELLNQHVDTLQRAEQREAKAQASQVRVVIYDDTPISAMGQVSAGTSSFWAVDVENRSQGQIRNVRVGLRPNGDPTRQYVNADAHLAVRRCDDGYGAMPKYETRLDILNDGYACLFVFGITKASEPEVDVAAPFRGRRRHRVAVQ